MGRNTSRLCCTTWRQSYKTTSKSVSVIASTAPPTISISTHSGTNPKSSCLLRTAQTRTMLAFKSLLCLALTTLVSASPIQSSEKRQEAPVVTYLGTQGPILSSGASTTSKGLVYTAGTVPSFNGSIVEGGIGPQTVRLPYTFAVSLSIPDQEFH
jgi:hypothetical protein